MYGLQYDEEGNWLETPLLVEAVGMPELPDVHEDPEAYQALFASLEDISYLLQSLQAEQGINQSYVTELHRLVPALEERLPLAMFTQRTSQTQYRLSMESLLSQAWDFIKKIFAAIREAIRNFFCWALGIPRDSGDQASFTEASVKQVTGLAQKIAVEVSHRKRVYQQVVKTAAAITPEEAQTAFLFQNSETGKVTPAKSFLHFFGLVMQDVNVTPAPMREAFFMLDPVWRDFVMEGTYSKAIGAAATGMPKMIEYAQLKGEAVQRFRETYDRGDDNTAHYQTRVIAGQPAGRTDHPHPNQAVTTSDQLDSLRFHLLQEKLVPTLASNVLDLVVRSARIWQDEPYADIALAMQKYEKSLAKLGTLESELEVFLNDASRIDPNRADQNPQLLQLAMQVTAAYSGEIMGLIKVMQHIRQYFEVIDQKTKTVSQAMAKVIAELEKQVKTGANKQFVKPLLDTISLMKTEVNLAK